MSGESEAARREGLTPAAGWGLQPVPRVTEPLPQAPLFSSSPARWAGDNDVCVTGSVERRWECTRAHGNTLPAGSPEF